MRRCWSLRRAMRSAMVCVAFTWSRSGTSSTSLSPSTSMCGALSTSKLHSGGSTISRSLPTVFGLECGRRDCALVCVRGREGSTRRGRQAGKEAGNETEGGGSTPVQLSVGIPQRDVPSRQATCGGSQQQYRAMTDDSRSLSQGSHQEGWRQVSHNRTDKRETSAGGDSRLPRRPAV
eukprot:2557277-Rhodomonas_salina.1